MKKIAGKEMRRLIYAVTAMTLALVIGVIAYFMIDTILTTNRNMEDNKAMVIRKSVVALEDAGASIAGLSSKPKFLQTFNQETLHDILLGDADRLYSLAVDYAMGVNPLQFAGVVAGGEVVEYRAADGVDPRADEISAEVPEGGYKVLDGFGGREGVYVSVFCPIDLRTFGFDEFYINLVIDRTAEMREIEGYFTSQRNALVARMSVVSLIAVFLALLITTFGLRYFTRRYVMDPLEALNRMAEEIADGSFEGTVEVDKDSAYAALQGLLRSGQLIVERMSAEVE